MDEFVPGLTRADDCFDPFNRFAVSRELWDQVIEILVACQLVNKRLLPVGRGTGSCDVHHGILLNAL